MAREVEIKDMKIKVRGLTRNEVREFRKSGVDFNKILLADADDVMDRVLEKVIEPGDFEKLGNIENHYSITVFKACMAETYGSPEEEKNSSAT